MIAVSFPTKEQMLEPNIAGSEITPGVPNSTVAIDFVAPIEEFPQSFLPTTVSTPEYVVVSDGGKVIVIVLVP